MAKLLCGTGRFANEAQMQTFESLFQSDGFLGAREQGIIVVDHGALKSQWQAMVADVVCRATLTLPKSGMVATGGRTGRHTESLGHMLSEMQIVARSHPGAKW